jgi:hypothetical protein
MTSLCPAIIFFSKLHNILLLSKDLLVYYQLPRHICCNYYSREVITEAQRSAGLDLANYIIEEIMTKTIQLKSSLNSNLKSMIEEKKIISLDK